MPAILPVSYTSVAFVYRALGELQSLANVSSHDLMGHAGQVQAVMNARLQRRYELPFTQDIPVLQSICTDITIYRVLALRIFTAGRRQESSWPDKWRKPAEDLLKEIADGTIPLENSSGVIINMKTTDIELKSNTMNYHQTFTDGLDFLDSIVDIDKEDDALDERDLGGT